MQNKVSNLLTKIVSISLVFAMLITTLVTNDLVVSAKGLFDNEPDVIEVDSIEKVKLNDTVDNDSNSDFKSCRLIIFSPNDLEFEEAESVTKYDNKYFVEYDSPKATEEAYNKLIKLGLEVEIDTVQDTPEDVENKDTENKEVSDKEIAKTNDKDKPTETIEAVKKNNNEDKTIVVAVLDTGVNVGEDVFTDRIIEGKNFIDKNKEDNTEDINGHGTSMSRVILDTVSSENKDSNIKIMPIKVLDDKGKGTTLTAYQGIKYAIEKKVDVINLSMSGKGQSKLLTSAINEAYNNGIPVVVSAGNENNDVAKYTPANIKSAFTISSADRVEKEDKVTYEKAIYSNYGSLDYSTNGVFEYTRIIDNEEVKTKVEGTSVSSAYVAGFVALLKQMAMSDEDESKHNLSITDINNSFLQSAIQLEDKKNFGEGYLSKENLVLTEDRIKDDSLKVDIISSEDLEENIDLSISERGRVFGREVAVYGFDPNTDWKICIYEVTDDHGAAAAAYGANTEIDSKTIGKNSYTEMTIFGGGLIRMWTYNDYAVIQWDNVLLQDTTTWCRAWLDLDNREYEYTEYIDTPGNSWQEDALPYYYQRVSLERWIDVYMGIGFKDKGVLFHSHPKHQNFNVTYDTNGGAFRDGKTSVTWEYDGTSGNNWFGVGIGASETPTKPGYNFRGWYISDNGQWRVKHTITNLVDYANRYNDLKAAFGYNMSSLNSHFWNYGIRESWRSLPEHKTTGDDYSQKNIIAEHCSGILDVFNGYDFDNYRQLLPANTFLTGYWPELCAGQNLVATAIWTPKTYSVKYNYNNGYNESETQSCQFDSAYKVHATPSKYKSANLVFDFNGGSAVGNIKVTKTFLGWDSDLDINNSGNDYRRSASSAYDSKINNARYINKNKDLYDAYGGYNNYMAYAHYVLYGQYEAGRPATKTGSGDINDSSNYYQPGKNFRNLSVNNNTINMTGRWKSNPQTLPSATKPGYDFLGWQINGTGKIYREGEKYLPPNDNDVKFVAVWRRNQGKVVYNPNGAVNDNNQQYSPVTDNSYTMLNGSYTTKDGDIFGKEVTEDGFIKNETTKNKVGTTITNKYILNDGDIINTLGTTDKLSTFQGWSSINYARHDTPNILYNGYVSKFMNIYYDVTAVNKLKIANAPNPFTINNPLTHAL